MIPNFNPNEETLKNKNILVSGCGSDLGYWVAIAAAKSGACVLLLEKKQRNMVGLYDHIIELDLETPTMIEFDLLKADESSFLNLSHSLDQEFPQIHGLVHCAMWAAPLTPIIHSNMEIWDKVLDQNLIRPMFLTKSLLANMKGSNPSSILFPVFESGRKGKAYWGAVGSAFAGIENLNETLAEEFESAAIRSNTIDCSQLRTAIRKKFYPGESGSALIAVDDQDVLNSFIYLLSDSNSNNGKQLIIPLMIDQ